MIRLGSNNGKRQYKFQVSPKTKPTRRNTVALPIMGEEDEKNQPPSARDVNSKPNPNSITPAQFAAWKTRKDANASASKSEAERKRAEDIAAGLVPLNGRELFKHEPWVFDNTRY